jgi:hypothetical protein
MLNRDDILERLIIAGGILSNLMIFMSMLAGCTLLWYFVFVFIFKG